MKKTFLRLALAFASFAVLFSFAGCGGKSETSSGSGAQNGDLLSQIKAKGEITVATEGAWRPWTYHNEADELVGFDVEVAKLIGEKLGVKVKFVEVDWDGIFAGINSKRYDITTNGVEITPERMEKYDFSEPYGYIRTAIIVRSDRTDINSFEDLKDRTTANSAGSTYADVAESYGAKVSIIDSFEETLQLVEQGRVEATLNAELSFMDYMAEFPDAPFKVTCLSQDASHVAIPFRKDGTTESLRAEINKAIQELKEEGKLSEVSLKYFGTDITK